MPNDLRHALAVMLLGTAAACSQPAQQEAPPATPTEAASTAAGTVATPVKTYADWAGKWVGPEGLFVEIRSTGAGTYSLTMQSDLDTVGTYDGQDGDGGITFKRGGKDLLLKAATGDQTGLKYLAGKTTCLMVAPGEGYCRD